MWNIRKIRETEKEAIAGTLKMGYEPFAVSTDMSGYCNIWFKKKEPVKKYDPLEEED